MKPLLNPSLPLPVGLAATAVFVWGTLDILSRVGILTPANVERTSESIRRAQQRLSAASAESQNREDSA